MVTEGELVLVQDEGEYVMRPGDCAAWPAGDTNGHCFLNRTDREARFLVVGSKAPHEVATYSDVDLVLEVKDGAAQLHLPRRHRLERPAVRIPDKIRCHMDSIRMPYAFHTRRFRQPTDQNQENPASQSAGIPEA